MFVQARLVLSGAAQCLSTATPASLPGALGTVLGDVACVQVILQPASANAAEILVGDANVDDAPTELCACKLPAPTGGVAPAPLVLGPFPTGKVKLKSFYVKGTLNDVVHLGIIPY